MLVCLILSVFMEIFFSTTIVIYDLGLHYNLTSPDTQSLHAASLHVNAREGQGGT